MRDGLDRYDTARPPGARGTGRRGMVESAQSVSRPAPRDVETVQRNVVRAHGTDVERQSEVEQDDTSLAADANGTPRPSAAKRHTQAERGNTKSAPLRDVGGRTASTAKRRSESEHGGVALVDVPNSGGHTASPGKRESQDELGRPSPAVAQAGGGRAASAPKRERRADGDGRDAAVGGVGGRATCADGPRFDADRRNASRTPERGGLRFLTSPAKRLAYAAGHDASAPVERSPTLERHLAALRCGGPLPGSRSRYIPAEVRREVWRRDQGCCSYVDGEAGGATAPSIGWRSTTSCRSRSAAPTSCRTSGCVAALTTNCATLSAMLAPGVCRLKPGALRSPRSNLRNAGGPSDRMQ
ncbi:MAG: hypothetical protein OXP36_00235 [Gammaproteobacteria bacterium]|nr:hypothetical protein [Gammaproteobacteria bacterium]